MAMVGMIGGRVEANAHLLGTIAGLLFLLAYYLVGYVKGNLGNGQKITNE